MTILKTLRMLRGGSWFNFPRCCRLALRRYARPGFTCSDSGFRVVCLPREIAP
jgi:formylglycine-generating enzyme required for sulfatase activity